MSPQARTATTVLQALRQHADPERARLQARYFRTGPGQYGEGDRFLGITVPQVRSVVRRFRGLSLNEVERLLESPWHEARLAAVLLLSAAYPKADNAPLNLLQSQSEQDNDAVFVAQLTEKATGPTGGLVHSIAEGATKGPLRRFAFETAFDLAAGSAFEGVAGAARAMRGPSAAESFSGFIRAPQGQVPKLRPETDPARLLAAENPELPPSPLPPEGPAIRMPGEVRPPIVPELTRPVEAVPLTHGRAGCPRRSDRRPSGCKPLQGWPPPTPPGRWG